MRIGTSTVSVAMATFNGARYLPEQLASLARQTHLPTELVVSDDGSDDGTLEILESFSRGAPFEVRVLSDQPRLGFAGNFGRALRCCAGDVVFFSDQDDVWHERKIERVYETMLARPHVHLVIHDRLITDGSLHGSGVSTLGALRARQGSVDDYVAGSSTALRRALVDLALPFPELDRLGHDSWVHLLARALDAVYVLDEPLMQYRRHGTNVSRSTVEPGGGQGRTKSLVASMIPRVRAAMSGGDRAESLLVNRELQAHLASRLQTPEAKAMSGNAPAAAMLATRRAAMLDLRLEAHDETWLRRWRLLERARRQGAYAPTARGWTAYALDLMSPRWHG
jgi:glycosyltransferase involved in cell wall biosynthesis